MKNGEPSKLTSDREERHFIPNLFEKYVDSFDHCILTSPNFMVPQALSLAVQNGYPVDIRNKAGTIYSPPDRQSPGYYITYKSEFYVLSVQHLTEVIEAEYLRNCLRVAECTPRWHTKHPLIASPQKLK